MSDARQKARQRAPEQVAGMRKRLECTGEEMAAGYSTYGGDFEDEVRRLAVSAMVIIAKRDTVEPPSVYRQAQSAAVLTNSLYGERYRALLVNNLASHKAEVERLEALLS